MDVDIVNLMRHYEDVNDVHIDVREADEMVDIHLINMTLVALGIGAGAVVLIAALIVVLAAVSQHRTALRRHELAVARAAAAARNSRAGSAPSAQAGPEPHQPVSGQAEIREPALR
jgi:hypothetical protein